MHGATLKIIWDFSSCCCCLHICYCHLCCCCCCCYHHHPCYHCGFVWHITC